MMRVDSRSHNLWTMADKRRGDKPSRCEREISRPLIHNAAAPISVSISITINWNASLIFRSGGQPSIHPSAFKRFNVHVLCVVAVWRDRWNKRGTNEETSPINNNFKPVLYWSKWDDETYKLKVLFIGELGIEKDLWQMRLKHISYDPVIKNLRQSHL